MLNRFLRSRTALPHPSLSGCYDLVMYSRTQGCPFVTVAKRALAEWNVPYQELMIDKDGLARERVLAWTGFLSVPTLVVAPIGELEPYCPIIPLANGQSPRGVNRGALITEPSRTELQAWLVQHGFLEGDS